MISKDVLGSNVLFNILEANAKQRSVATRLNKVMDKNVMNLEEISGLL